jgi:hypothetical protein
VSRDSAILHAVRTAEPERRAFCGYCGRPPAGAPEGGGEGGAVSRVCGDCGLGLLLTADAGLAPAVEDAFLVVDAGLNVRALSAAAEKLCDLAEIDVVDQPLENLLVAADSSEDARARLHGLVAGAARGPLSGGEPAVAIVRPARAFGVRWRARVGRCEPGYAALVVLSPL